jgi:hypothetical protein
LRSRIPQDKIALLLHLGRCRIAVLIEWIKEDLSGFLKCNTMIQNIELRLLIISLELNALKAVHNNHTSPHCQEPDVSMIPRVGGEGIAARRKIVNGAMPLMDCAQRVAHQPPQARCTGSPQKPHDLARAAVGCMGGLGRSCHILYPGRDRLVWRGACCPGDTYHIVDAQPMLVVP